MIKSQTANNAVGSGTTYTTTEYQYNWQNQPTKVKGFNGNEVESCVQYYYDSLGNVLRMYTGDVDDLVINGLDNVSGSNDYAVTKYAYDSMNRCISQTDALGQTVTNTYDINGNLISATDRNGNTLSYSYDGLNQLLSKSSSKTTADTYTYSYNMKGNRTGMTGGGVDTTSVYDNLGRLTKESLTDGTVKEYTYDINGNRKSFKLTKDNAEQYTLTYDYDKMNRLTKVYEDGNEKAEYEYNDDGTLKKASYGSQTTDYSYNLANLLTEVNNANGSTQISKYSYTYYVDGNQKSKTESVDGSNKGTTNYTYDGLNRLIKEQAPDKTYSYQYDSYGNRSQLSVTGDESYTTSYSYDKNNRLRKETKTAGNASEITDYWYDPNGNQISSMTVTTGTEDDAGVGIEPAGGNTNSINEYDSWNQLTKTMQNSKTASYTYNGDGLRMSKTVDGTTTRHIWDGTNIAGDVTNGTVTKYIRGIQLISSKTGSNESFYTYNAHGDVVQLTNGSGNITKQYSYDAFGVEQNRDANDTNPFRYCGEYFDGETENVYLRARYYSPVSGRFITEDPIMDGLNWYAYCDGNPISRIDISGYEWGYIRDFAEDLGMLYGDINFSAGQNSVVVRLGNNDAIGEFTYDGYAYIKSTGKNEHIGQNINGKLYMNREDFYKAMYVPYAIYKQEYIVTEEKNRMIGYTVGGIGVIAGTAIGSANQLAGFVASIISGVAGYELSPGFSVGKYNLYITVVDSYNEYTGLYQSVFTLEWWMIEDENGNKVYKDGPDSVQTYFYDNHPEKLV